MTVLVSTLLLSLIFPHWASDQRQLLAWSLNRPLAWCNRSEQIIRVEERQKGRSRLQGVFLQTLRVQSSSSEQEDIQVEVTRLLVESYFDLVRKNLQDAVPKAIMHFLVLYVQRGLQQRLIRSLYRYSSSSPLLSVSSIFQC